MRYRCSTNGVMDSFIVLSSGHKRPTTPALPDGPTRTASARASTSPLNGHDIRGRHDHVLATRPNLPVPFTYDHRKHRGSGRPQRALNALHIQLLCSHDDGPPELLTIESNESVLHALGRLKPAPIYAGSTWALPSNRISESRCSIRTRHR